ncbi:hypothetical protein PFUM301597_17100 [Pseudomonas fluorescens]
MSVIAIGKLSANSRAATVKNFTPVNEGIAIRGAAIFAELKQPATVILQRFLSAE